MKAFFTVWLLAAVTQGRFNTESPLIIRKIITEEENQGAAVKKIEFLDQLSDVLEYQDSIISLNFDIKGEKIESTAAETIAELVEKKITRLLVLKSCVVSSDSLSSIVSSALWKSETRCLVIHNCRLDFDSLSCFDVSPSMPLKIVGQKKISQNGFPESQPAKKFMKKNNSEERGRGQDIKNDHLILLDVSFNNLDSKNIKELSVLINKCKKLRVLVLDGNKMTLKDLQILLETLHDHPSINHVSLSDCGLSDESMEYINFCLKMNRNLTSIDISSNKITTAGMYVLTEGFRAGGGRKLENLDISYNVIGDLGIQCLANSISLGQLPILKNLKMKQVDAGTVSLERLFNSFPYGSLLESIDISGNALFLSKKSKKKKIGYSPKNLSKKLLSLTPQISNVMKSLSGAITLQIKSAGKVIDSQTKSFIKMTKSKKSKYGAKKLLKSKRDVDPESSMSRKKLQTSKSSKKGSLSDERRQKHRKIADESKNNFLMKKKILISSRVKKTVILSEEKLIEKSRIRSIRSIMNFLKTTRNLKKIGFAKVGLSDASCVIFQQEFDKMKMSNKINDLKIFKSSNEMKINDLKKSSLGDKDVNERMNRKSISGGIPQVSIYQEIPEIITSIEESFQTKNMEKDIDLLIYKNIKFDGKLLSESNNEDSNHLDENNENDVKLTRKRDLEVIIYLNELSLQSSENLINILQLS